MVRASPLSGTPVSWASAVLSSAPQGFVMVYSTLLTAQPMLSGSSFKHGARTLLEYSSSSTMLQPTRYLDSLLVSGEAQSCDRPGHAVFGKTVENSGALD